MKKVIKPFWSYDIIKIENWLSNMASEGYILEDINTYTRVFKFSKESKQRLTYKIYYENKGIEGCSPSLKREGWKSIYSKNRWNFMCNEKNKEDIKINPSRENILKRNRNIKYVLWFILCFYLMTFLPLLLILGFSFGGAALGIIPVEFEDSITPESIAIDYGAYMGQTVFFILIFMAIYTIIKLNKLDKQLRKENGYPIDEEEKNIEIKDKSKIIKKIKPAWSYSPDKTEKWLEDMESKGFNLCKISKWSSVFYFEKGNPRKIKYVLDYQGATSETYYEIHKEDGWKLNLKTIGSISRWSIWSKEYDDIKPEIYSNNEEILNHSKKTLIVHSMCFIPVLMMSIASIITEIELFITRGITSSGWIISIILMIEFGIFYMNIVGYYVRTRKRVLENK